VAVSYDLISLDNDNFNQIITNSKGVYVVVFETSWSGKSQIMYPVVLAMKEMFKSSILVAKLDEENCENIVKKYAIERVPTFLFFFNGKICDKIVGLISKKEMIVKIAALIEDEGCL